MNGYREVRPGNPVYALDATAHIGIGQGNVIVRGGANERDTHQTT